MSPDAASEDWLENSTSFGKPLLLQVVAQITSGRSDLLRAYGLTDTRLAMLRYLANGTCDVILATAAKEIGRSPATATEALRHLLANKQVERTRGTFGRRSLIVTHLGLEALAAIRDWAAEVDRATDSHVGRAKLINLQTALCCGGMYNPASRAV